MVRVERGYLLVLSLTEKELCRDLLNAFGGTFGSIPIGMSDDGHLSATLTDNIDQADYIESDKHVIYTYRDPDFDFDDFNHIVKDDDADE